MGAFETTLLKNLSSLPSNVCWLLWAPAGNCWGTPIVSTLKTIPVIESAVSRGIETAQLAEVADGKNRNKRSRAPDHVRAASRLTHGGCGDRDPLQDP